MRVLLPWVLMLAAPWTGHAPTGWASTAGAVKQAARDSRQRDRPMARHGAGLRRRKAGAARAVRCEGAGVFMVAGGRVSADLRLLQKL